MQDPWGHDSESRVYRVSSWVSTIKPVIPAKLGKGFSSVVLVVLVPSGPVADKKHLPVRESFIRGDLPPLSMRADTFVPFWILRKTGSTLSAPNGLQWHRSPGRWSQWQKPCASRLTWKGGEYQLHEVSLSAQCWLTASETQTSWSMDQQDNTVWEHVRDHASGQNTLPVYASRSCLSSLSAPAISSMLPSSRDDSQ